MAKALTDYLLLILILSLGFGQLLRIEIYNIPLYFHDLLTCLILLINLSHFLKILNRFGNIKVFSLGLMLSWIYALTLYPPITLLIPSLYTLRLFTYLSLFFLLKNAHYKVNKSYFVSSGIIMFLIGLSQYLLHPDMRWAHYLGWDDHLNRLTLPHYDPTFTGVMLSLAILTLPCNITHKVLCTLYYVLCIIPILLTYARSVWLSLLLTTLTMFKSLKYIILITIIFVLAIVALPDRFGEGNNLLRTYSIASRFESDMGYVKQYGWSLLIGRGLNTLILDQKEAILPNHSTGPNNSYLYVLSTTGIIGLLGWGIFMRSIYQESKNKPMLAFFFVASLFNNVMFYPFALLWILLSQFMVPTEA